MIKAKVANNILNYLTRKIGWRGKETSESDSAVTKWDP